MRRLAAAVGTLGLAVAGAEVAHAVAYRLVVPGADARAHALAESGHAYMRWAPLGLALVTVAVALAFVIDVGDARRGREARSPRAHLMLAVAPAVFALQEHFERLLHDGSFPWGAATERTFLIGLALQVPFALAAYGLATVLLRTARVMARLLGESPRWLTVVLDQQEHGFVRARRRSSNERSLGARAPPVPGC